MTVQVKMDASCWTSRGAAILARSLPVKSTKGSAPDVSGTLGTHSRLVYGVTGAQFWTRNNTIHGFVFATKEDYRNCVRRRQKQTSKQSNQQQNQQKKSKQNKKPANNNNSEKPTAMCPLKHLYIPFLSTHTHARTRTHTWYFFPSVPL